MKWAQHGSVVCYLVERNPTGSSSTDSALLKTETLKAFDKKHVFWKCKFWL